MTGVQTCALPISTYTYTLNHNHGTDVDNFVLCTPSSWNSAMILQVDIEPQGQCTSNGQIQLDGATGQTGLKFVCTNLWNGASSVTVSVTANGLFSTLQGTTIYSTAGNQCSSEIVSGGGWGCSIAPANDPYLCQDACSEEQPTDFESGPALNDECNPNACCGHAIWLPGIENTLVWDSETPPAFQYDEANGSGLVTGRVVDATGLIVFDVNVWVSDQYYPAGDIPFHLGAPKKELQSWCYIESGPDPGIDPSSWTYFENWGGTFVSPYGTYEGAELSIGLFGPPCQIGYGANGKNTGYGMAMWFSRVVTKQGATYLDLDPAQRGDFNLDLTVQIPDQDSDGSPDCSDGCPDDPDKAVPGFCGCGNPDIDTDGDGVLDCNDGCPDDGTKTTPDVCGCGSPDTDSDGDGTPDCTDACPNDPTKVVPGACPCGVPNTDTDGDGVPDCNDGCPDDPTKTSPGPCGCGAADADSDGDGTIDCQDGCPSDPNKTDPEVCGCGVLDVDWDSDGVLDCLDGCPTNPLKTDPGICGCPTPDYDSDQDGVPDRRAHV